MDFDSSGGLVWVGDEKVHFMLHSVFTVDSLLTDTYKTDTSVKRTPRVGPCFLCSLYLTFYKTDISLRRTANAGPKGVRLRESLLYSNSKSFQGSFHPFCTEVASGLSIFSLCCFDIMSQVPTYSVLVAFFDWCLTTFVTCVSGFRWTHGFDWWPL